MERPRPGDRQLVTTAPKLAQLQVLRAIAASLVVVDHAVEAMVTRDAIGPLGHQVGWFCGWLGVVTFFIISGLIMARIAGNQSGPRSGFRFLMHRVMRVVPLYWIVTVIYIGLWTLSGRRFSLEAIIKSLLFIPYRADQAEVMRPIVGQGWTLNYEMFFYVMFAVCLMFPLVIRIRLMLAALLVIVLAGFVTRDFSSYADPITVLAFWSDPIILFFGIGIIINSWRVHLYSLFANSLSLIISFVLFGAVIGIFLVADIRFPLPVAWQLGLGMFCATAVFVCAAARAQIQSAFGRALVVAGDASYSTYLIHPLAVGGLGVACGHFPVAAHYPAVFIFVSVIVANVVGIVVHYALEQPLMTISRRQRRRESAHSQRREDMPQPAGR